MKSNTSKRIEDLLSRITPPTVEEARELEIIDRLQAVMQKYQSILSRPENEKNITQSVILKKYNLYEILTPQQLNAFLQATIVYEQEQQYYRRTGIFTTALIHNSYQAGYNEFSLAMPTSQGFFAFLEGLAGTKENPIQLHLQGYQSFAFARYTRFINCTVNGRVYADACQKTQDSTFFFSEIVMGDGFFYEAQNCTVVLASAVSPSNQPVTANHCVFKCYHRQTAEELVKRIASGNKIIYINTKGKEEILCDND